jgi:energy-coupling factor transport system ATP-binding protein
VALVEVSGLEFIYPGGAQPALEGVSLRLEPGEVVALLGPSGSGKSTLLRALAGLVPHFHGGRFAGSVLVAGMDTRRSRPAVLAGTTAAVFQDPEDQVVMALVRNEVAFGLENLGVPSAEIWPRTDEALDAVGALHLAERRTSELSGGELQRVCLASALALRPRLLLLDEPTSQLDPAGAAEFLELVAGLGVAALIVEQRPARVLHHADRIVHLDAGRLFDGEPEWPELAQQDRSVPRELVCRLQNVQFAYRPGRPVLTGFDLDLRRGEIVTLAGLNGTGKTTVAKLAAGLLEPDVGSVVRTGPAAMLLQDPGRYAVRERAEEEVALGVGGDRARARRALAAVGLAGYERRHPRDLSSGERERLALASVLVTEPDLLVLDEPTRGIDPARKAQLAELLRSEAGRRATLVVTHDEEFASAVGDRPVVLGREALLV